jgi:hypothetical protein
VHCPQGSRLTPPSVFHEVGRTATPSAAPGTSRSIARSNRSPRVQPAHHRYPPRPRGTGTLATRLSLVPGAAEGVAGAHLGRKKWRGLSESVVDLAERRGGACGWEIFHQSPAMCAAGSLSWTMGHFRRVDEICTTNERVGGPIGWDLIHAYWSARHQRAIGSLRTSATKTNTGGKAECIARRSYSSSILNGTGMAR